MYYEHWKDNKMFKYVKINPENIIHISVFLTQLHRNT